MPICSIYVEDKTFVFYLPPFPVFGRKSFFYTLENIRDPTTNIDQNWEDTRKKDKVYAEAALFHTFDRGK